MSSEAALEVDRLTLADAAAPAPSDEEWTEVRRRRPGRSNVGAGASATASNRPAANRLQTEGAHSRDASASTRPSPRGSVPPVPDDQSSSNRTSGNQPPSQQPPLNAGGSPSRAGSPAERRLAGVTNHVTPRRWEVLSTVEEAAQQPEPPEASDQPGDDVAARGQDLAQANGDVEPQAKGGAAAAPVASEGGTDSHQAESPEERTASAEDRVQDALIWIDLEMTGLDLDSDVIIEIAVIITDGSLQKRIMGPDIAVHHSDDVLDGMNEWSREHHGRSGLTQKCRESTVSLQEAEAQVLEFVQRHTDASTEHHLAGSSVHVDLAFLRRGMPRLAAHVPYRVVDVSTVMELCRRWYPKVWKRMPRVPPAHTALADVTQSIRLLEYFRDNMFRSRPAA